jgi:DNA mismatch repair ATPase MutL
VDSGFQKLCLVSSTIQVGTTVEVIDFLFNDHLTVQLLSVEQNEFNYILEMIRSIVFSHFNVEVFAKI